MAPYILGEIRRFETSRFTVVVDAIENDLSVDDLIGEEDQRAEMVENLDSGKWIAFTARARVLLDGDEIASDYLGGCVYESLCAFMDHKECGAENKRLAAAGEDGRCGSYFRQMISTVCDEARDRIRELQSVRVR